MFADTPGPLREARQDEGDARPWAVRLDWQDGWMVCWFVPRAEAGGGTQLHAVDSSRYGHLSRYDVQQAFKMRRVQGYGHQAFVAAPAWRIALLYLLQQLLNAISLGCVYALLAVGYTLVYGITGVINFAYGPLYTMGAFVLVASWGGWGMAAGLAGGLVLALAWAALTGAAAGFGMASWVFRPLGTARSGVALIAAIGLAIALQEWIRLAQGPRTRYVLVGRDTTWPLLQGLGFDVVLSKGHVAIGLATLGIGLLLWWLQMRTRFGRAQRAIAQDRGMAALLGIDVDRTVAVTFAVGGALAGIAGMFAAAQYGVVTFRMGTLVALKALTAALLGGIGSLPGAALGGALVALVEVLAAAYVASEWKDVAVFAVLVLVLVFRPRGLLGGRATAGDARMAP
ncbi:MAG: branched-chain amino acid ABC transporter permease [Geminicoccaceae bacterium]